MAAAAPGKREEKAPEFDKAAEAIWNAEFLLVVMGPLFDDSRPYTASEYCDPTTVSNPNKFMGYWGGLHNEYSDRTPHDGYNIIKAWRDRFFCQDDIRKRQPKKRPEEESDLDRLPRCHAYTRSVSSYLQKVGFPSEEVYELCGNIFLWQCSRNPPCCTKVTSIDRAFRFEIDETNQEAQPIKYVTDKRDDKPKEKFKIVDQEEEDLKLIEETIQHLSTDPRNRDERGARKVQRVIERAQVVKITPTLQVGYQRFPDLFVGIPTTNKQRVGKPNTFDNAPVDPKALHIPTLNTADDEKDKKEVPAHLRVVELPCVPALRASHLLAHVNSLDRGMYNSKLGKFHACDPEKWHNERLAYYQSVSKMHRSSSHHIAMQRAKSISYNISFVITTPQSTSASAARASAADDYAPRPNVLPPALLKKLISPNGPPEPQAQAELQEQLKAWEQGKHGWYYFSNVLSRETHQEPVNFKFHDEIHIPFPAPTNDPKSPTSAKSPRRGPTTSPATANLNENGDGATNAEEGHPAAAAIGFRLPQHGTISVVCETVVCPPADAAPKQPPPGKRAQEETAPPCPATYTGNVWQLTGTLTPPDFTDIHEFKKNPPPDAIFEYVLEDRLRHVVKIGVLRSDPTLIKYVEVESPCDEETAPTPTVVTKCARVPEDVGATRGDSFAFMDRHRDRSPRAGDVKADPKSRPMPTPNHILCVHCHDVARPYVLMTKPGVKDENFCTGQLAQRTKAFKLWEKQMIEAMKQDNNKSLVLLEVGADKKADPCRNYAEKTFKSLKSSKCTMVRISPHNLEAKAKGGAGQQEQPNHIALQTPIVQGLIAIERLLVEKMRKKDRG